MLIFDGRLFWLSIMVLLVRSNVHFILSSILISIHTGVVPWDDPTSPDIKSSASAFAQKLPTIKTFIFNPNATYSQLTYDRIDIGLWTVNSQTLVMATNMNYNTANLDLSNVPTQGKNVKQVFSSGAAVNGTKIVFQSVGSGAFILS